MSATGRGAKRVVGDGEAMIARAETPEAKREVVERLLAVWLQRPALRFGQLLTNARLRAGGITDLFYVEDTELVDEVER